MEDRFLLQSLEFEGVLRAYLYRYTRNVSDVEELLQETYARLLVAGADTELRVGSIRAFALTVAGNVARDWWRQKQVIPIELMADMEALEILDEAEQIEEIVNADQELALLASAVEQLPPRCRQVFTLRKVYGYSWKEIADRLQISENTVHRHLVNGARYVANVSFGARLPEPSTVLRWLGRIRQPKKKEAP